MPSELLGRLIESFGASACILADPVRLTEALHTTEAPVLISAPGSGMMDEAYHADPGAL